MVLWIVRRVIHARSLYCGGVLKSQCRIIIKRFINLWSMKNFFSLFLKPSDYVVISNEKNMFSAKNVWCTHSSADDDDDVLKSPNQPTG